MSSKHPFHFLIKDLALVVVLFIKFAFMTPKNIIQNETSVLEKYLFNTGSREMVLTIVFGPLRSM